MWITIGKSAIFTILILPIPEYVKFFSIQIYFNYFPQCSRFSLWRFFQFLGQVYSKKVFFFEAKVNGVMGLFPQFLSQNVGYCHINSIPPSSPLHFIFPLLLSIQGQFSKLSPSHPCLPHNLAIVTSSLTDMDTRISMETWLFSFACTVRMYNWIKCQLYPQSVEGSACWPVGCVSLQCTTKREMLLFPRFPTHTCCLLSLIVDI